MPTGIIGRDFAGVLRVHAFTTVGVARAGSRSQWQVLPFLYLALAVGLPVEAETGPGCTPSRLLTGIGPRCLPVAGTVCAACWRRRSPSGWFWWPWFRCPCGARGGRRVTRVFRPNGRTGCDPIMRPLLANAVEQYYYSHHTPPEGGRPARLNAVPAPGGPPAAAVRAGLPRPARCRWWCSPALPGEGRWTPADAAVRRCAGHVRGPVPRR